MSDHISDNVSDTMKDNICDNTSETVRNETINNMSEFSSTQPYIQEEARAIISMILGRLSDLLQRAKKFKSQDVTSHTYDRAEFNQIIKKIFKKELYCLRALLTVFRCLWHIPDGSNIFEHAVDDINNDIREIRLDISNAHDRLPMAEEGEGRLGIEEVVEVTGSIWIKLSDLEESVNKITQKNILA
ncbi:hypothetical protein BDV96DRAFT_564649 [Lophiotrema nucula]|uniref:Uncharacterized protein n=1 Tax=Lophiotrema nucula TaxID=690887 RepID=A0A6A5ZPN0_9PLEO|nr:hypothetical protein BDV96DRAFT_564649 [Lophiotrema nucula]